MSIGTIITVSIRLGKGAGAGMSGSRESADLHAPFPAELGHGPSGPGRRRA